MAEYAPSWSRIAVAVGCLLVVSIFGCDGSEESPSGELSATFESSTDSLVATQIVPTLDTPIKPGQNAIWCATFQAAWKELQDDVVGEAAELDGESAISDRLNDAENPAEYMSPESFYATAGWASDGIIERIQREFGARFPDEPSPVFPAIAPGGFVAYAYLRTRAAFTVPYFDADEPMQFEGANGRKTPVRAFGIRDEDGDKYGELRRQAKVLFESYQGDEHNPIVDEFILDLCVETQPVQIIAARIERKDTIEETMTYIDEKTRNPDDHWYIGGNDVILVPNMCWRLSHRFSDLEKKPFINDSVVGKHIDVAMQDIQLRLDRSGAELAAQAEMRWASEGKDLYVFNRPFLLVFRLRDSQKPFFAMWVDNAELLYPWD